MHLAHLQIEFRQRMKKKQHDVLIFNFCNKIKNRLTTQRDKRRRRVAETSSERKQKWSAKLMKKLRKKNKMNEVSIEKTWHKFFRVNDSRHETLIKRQIDVAFARRWQRTSRAKDWNCTKSWLNQKTLLSRTCVQNALSSLIICSFDACQSCYCLTVLVIILDKRSSTCCFSAWTKSRTNKTCLKLTKRRIYASYLTSRRNSRRQ